MNLDEELFEAVKKGDAEKLKEFLSKGIKTDLRDKEGFTPLHYAVINNRKDIAEILIKHGANVNTKNLLGETPLHYSARLCLAEIAELLVSSGANVNITNNYGMTPLHYSAHNNCIAVAKVLIDNSADPNIREDNGCTPLHWASSNCYLDMVWLLLEGGASPHITNKDGKTPIDLAREKNCIEIVRKLVERGAVTRHSEISIVEVKSSGLKEEAWGKLIVKIRGRGVVHVLIEGDVEWLDPGAIDVSGEAVIEVPIRPKVAGEVPVKITVESLGRKETKLSWLKIESKSKSRHDYPSSNIM
jgi:ankyrin repeat protein